MSIQTLVLMTAVPLLGLAVLSGAAAQTKTPAASEIIARIKAKVGVAWTEPTVDTCKEGDPATQVTGIAGTMMPTLEVLQQAARRGVELQRPDELIPMAQTLARRHVAYGVKNEHYAPVGAALLHTLGAGLGDAFTDDVKDAWIAAYTTLSAVMTHAAATA